MIALFVLMVATLLCAAVVHFGASVAEAVLPGLGLSAPDANLAAIETVYVLIIYGSLLISGLIGGTLSGGNAIRLGNRPFGSATGGFVLGASGVAAAASYAWLANNLSVVTAPAQPAFLWGSAIVLLQATSEEVYFRGWLQPYLARHWGPVAAIILSALAFAGLHIFGGARSPVTLINLFLGGLLFGALAYYRQGVAGAVAAHFAWNWTEQIVLGLVPNPGVSSFGALYDLELAGSAFWGGSDEGLNASIAMTLTLIALLIPVLLLIRGRRAVPIQPAKIG